MKQEFALIKDGVVENLVSHDPDYVQLYQEAIDRGEKPKVRPYSPPDGYDFRPASGAGIGWVVDGDTDELVPPPIPPKTREEIEDDIRSALAATDAGMARVAEDIIGLLIGKGVFTAEEMPESVREKIQAREALRSQINERKR